MATAVSPTLPAIAPQPPAGATSAVVLQPGTVVDATVLKAAEDLVQIAIAGLAIDVLSEVPLSAGQNLQLAVSQTQDGTIRLAVAGEGTALGATALSAGRATETAIRSSGVNGSFGGAVAGAAESAGAPSAVPSPTTARQMVPSSVCDTASCRF